MPDMNENAETQQEYFGLTPEEPKKNHWYEMYELECLKTKELEKQIEKMKKCLKGLVYMADSGLQAKNELAFARLIAEAKDLLKE